LGARQYGNFQVTVRFPAARYQVCANAAMRVRKLGGGTRIDSGRVCRYYTQP
jgi:hypothetical protein